MNPLIEIPSWVKVIVAGAVGIGSWLGTIELRLDNALSEKEFYEYMDTYKVEQKRDFQRLEDKIDKKADKP